MTYLSSTPAISVIVLNWNGKHLLRDCLRSLRKQTLRDFETILVDNGSTDGSVAFVRSEFTEVKVVELPSNLGFCGGNNRGVLAARGEYILFLNNDTEVHPAMLAELYQAIQEDPKEVGSWAVKMLRWDWRDRIDNCGCGFSAFGGGYPIGSRGSDGASSELKWVFGPSGGAACYRRSVLDEIGLFDEDFFYNNEDVDLSFRAQLAGYRCHYVSTAIVYHCGSATSGAISDRTIYHIQRNQEWVFFKNMPTPLLWKYLLSHFFYSVGWIVYWTIKGKANVVFRAKRDALRGWRDVLNKRGKIQSRRRVDLCYLDHLIDKRRILQVFRSESLRFRLKRKTA